MLTVVQRETHEGSETMFSTIACLARCASKKPVKTGIAICMFHAFSPIKIRQHYLCKFKVQKAPVTYKNNDNINKLDCHC